MLRDITIPKELISRTDLTLAEKFVAAFLSDGHSVTAVEIADALNITRVTVYRSLKKLIEGGFLLAEYSEDTRKSSYRPVGYRSLTSFDGGRHLYQ